MSEKAINPFLNKGYVLTAVMRTQHNEQVNLTECLTCGATITRYGYDQEKLDKHSEWHELIASMAVRQ